MCAVKKDFIGGKFIYIDNGLERDVVTFLSSFCDFYLSSVTNFANFCCFYYDLDANWGVFDTLNG